MRKHTLQDYGVLYFALVLYSISSVFAKLAAGQDGLWRAAVCFSAEILFLGFYALVWQKALKRFPLVVAMSSKGLTVLLSLFWSVVLFHESVGFMNLLGAALVIGGVVMVSGDG